ncbi:MAG: glycosyltransferase family 4 protein [Thermoplasmata archaeon]
MHISFVLPGSAHHPVGGFKVVFEYANKLSELGHIVSVFLVADAYYPEKNSSIIKRNIRLAYFYYRKFFKSYLPDHWFNRNNKVRFFWVLQSHLRKISYDAIIATSWQTALIVNNLTINRSEKFYLIQHLETWSGSYEKVINTWKLPLRKIVISQWLKKFADDLGEESYYIPNGLDFSAFNIDTSIDSRDNNTVMMLYHKAEWKGTEDGLEALRIVKKLRPDITAVLFGVFSAPKFETWIHYFKNPSQKKLRALYNSSSIFVSPSWAEGFPLPPCEAMMCGAALVATDIGGHREMAIDHKTALLCPTHSPTQLAQCIIDLLDNPPLRYSIADSAYQHIQQFTWDKSCKKLIDILS